MFRWPGKIKKTLLFVVCFVFAGCDYEVPLSASPKMTIDNRAVGLWEQTKEDGKKEYLLVLPLNKYEYLLVWPKGNTSELYARAHLFEFNGNRLVQLEWFGNSDGGVPDDNRIYQIGKYAISGDTMETQLLNTDVVNKNSNTSVELAEAIKSNSSNPSLFRKKIIYKKITR